jgi:hypothetical protein
MRQWVEKPDGAFPPPPVGKDVPQPLYGVVRGVCMLWARLVGDRLPGWLQVDGSLDPYWRPKQRTELSWSALEMLYTPRQQELYKGDADIPADADTPWYRPQGNGAFGQTDAGTDKRTLDTHRKSY